MHFAPGLRPGTPCSQSRYSRTLPTARGVNLQIWPGTSVTPSLLGKNHCLSLDKRKNGPRWPAVMITPWAPFAPKLVKTVQKNKEASMDSRDPRHDWTLSLSNLDWLYGGSTGKIEAECVREGSPLNFGPSKVVTFGEKMSFFLVYLLNGAK